MNHKILLGSIIAVVILVLVSFTGVVGYQTTKSSTIARVSPLFSIRSKRAIDKESKDIACDYVGKGEEIGIQIPMRDNRGILLQKTVERISLMNNKEFIRFIDMVNSFIHQDNTIQEVNIGEIVSVLELLRENPNILWHYENISENVRRLDQGTWPITCGCFPDTTNLRICLLFFSLFAIWYIVFMIKEYIIVAIIWFSNFITILDCNY